MFRSDDLDRIEAGEQVRHMYASTLKWRRIDAAMNSDGNFGSEDNVTLQPLTRERRATLPIKFPAPLNRQQRRAEQRRLRRRGR